MQVKVLPSAEDDLEYIFEYHVEYNPHFAISFQWEILSFFMKNLSDYPEMWTIHNVDLQIRKLVFQNYNIYYKVQSDLINILHIVHEKTSLNQDLGE